MEKLIDYSMIIWVLLIFIVIPAIIQIYVIVISKRRKRIEYLGELAGYVESEYQQFIEEHDNYSEDKALWLFFSNKENETKALNIKKEIKNNTRRVTTEDIQRLKEDIQRRKREEYLKREENFFKDSERYL